MNILAIILNLPAARKALRIITTQKLFILQQGRQMLFSKGT